MKKIVLLVALCLCVGNLFAQDADKLRDEGDAALKAKDYATVVTKYGEYLKQNNYQDTARIFNCGYAANQAKNYAEAAKYFDMAVKMNYNVDDSYVGEAMAYRNLNKTEEFLTTVKEGLKVIPDGNKNKTNLEKLLYGYCIKQGQAAAYNDNKCWNFSRTISKRRSGTSISTACMKSASERDVPSL